MPKPAQDSSTATAPSTARRPSAGVVATSTVARVRPCTPTAEAGWIMMSPSGPDSAHTLPSGFHGKPVSTNCRAMSASVHSPASSIARRHPAGARREAAQGRAMNGARPAAVIGTANGTSHQNWSAFTRIASVIQYSPTRWCPKPKA